VIVYCNSHNSSLNISRSFICRPGVLDLDDESQLGYIVSTTVMENVYMNIPQWQGNDDD
jgi:hypothetical protein